MRVRARAIPDCGRHRIFVCGKFNLKCEGGADFNGAGRLMEPEN